MDLDHDIIFSLIESSQEFPIDFDYAWQWIEYSRKDSAKSSLLNAGFIEGTDFRISQNNQENSKVGRPSEKIMLTVECFKSFCMMAGTLKGREVRKYFLDCEQELKRRIEEEKKAYTERVVNAVVDGQHLAWQKRFEDNFFEEAYRITGWQKTAKGHPSCMGHFINDNIYNLLPVGVTKKLKEVNPANSSGGRSRKHHQHLTQNIGLPLLDYQKGVTIAVMRLSPSGSMKKLKQNMQKACGTVLQVEMPFMEEFEVD
jgi:phage anti-repressor protein